MKKPTSFPPARGPKFEVRPVLDAPAVKASVAKAGSNSRKMPPPPMKGRKK